MGVKLNFAAVNELPNPLEPGTIYYLHHEDGTATQLVTDATGQITGRQIVGLMTSGSLGRTGAVTNRLTKNATTLAHQFTNTSGAPIVLSSVTIEGLTLSAGTAELTVWSQAGQLLASAPATAQNGGLTAPLAYTIPAGAIVLIGAVSTGGYLTAALSSGHTWPGLTMSNVGLYTSISVVQGGILSEDNGDPTAQLRFQFGTGGQLVRKIEAGAGLTGSVQAGIFTVDLAPLDLSATGDGAVSEIMWAQDNRHVSAGEIMRVRSNADQELGSVSLYWRATTEHAGAATQARLSLRTLAGAMLIESPWQALPAALTWQPFALSLNLSAGQEVALHTEYDVDVSGNVNLSPMGGYRATADTNPPTTEVATADGAYTTFSAASTTNSPTAVRFTQPGGLFRGQLPGERVEGFAELEVRVSTLETDPGPSSSVTVSATAPEAPSVGQQWKIPGSYLLTCVSINPDKWEDALGADRTPIPAGAFTHYRLNITASGAEYTSIALIQLRAVAGGPSIASGGSAFGSPAYVNSQYGTQYSPDSAFDADPMNYWAVQGVGIIGYHLGTAQAVVEYAIKGTGSAGESPTAWTFQGSNDGATWTTLDTRAGVTWAANELKVFTVPS